VFAVIIEPDKLGTFHFVNEIQTLNKKNATDGLHHFPLHDPETSLQTLCEASSRSRPVHHEMTYTKVMHSKYNSLLTH
jgi:hypothetical protein